MASDFSAMARVSALVKARRRREHAELIELKRQRLIDTLARDDDDERARLMAMPYWEIVCEKNGPAPKLPGYRTPTPGLDDQSGATT